MLGIAPWNAPIILGVRALATPLACGNAVVFKASEVCPRTHALIVEAFEEAGLPEGRRQPRHQRARGRGRGGRRADRPSGGAPDQLHRLDRASAGSSRCAPAQNLKPVLLELGGKAPLLVLEDADLDEAVKAAAFGAFFNQGQICMSTERIIVVDAVADAFAREVRGQGDDAGRRRPARGQGAARRGGRRATTVDSVEALIDDARRQGRRAALAGGMPRAC